MKKLIRKAKRLLSESETADILSRIILSTKAVTVALIGIALPTLIAASIFGLGIGSILLFLILVWGTDNKALTSYIKVRILRVRNLFLTPEEREEWLGDLREQVQRMKDQKRSKWAIRRFKLYQHCCFGISKLKILIERLFSKIIGG